MLFKKHYGGIKPSKAKTLSRIAKKKPIHREWVA
jgi:hypothetical protein